MADKVLSPVIEGVVESPLGKEYPQFDGTAYATIPAWTPVSARAAEIVRFRRDFDDGVARNLTGSADAGADGIRISTSYAPSVVYLDDADALRFAIGVGDSIRLGVDHEIRAEFYPDRVECWLDGELVGTSLVAPKQSWLREYIGVTAPSTENFIGPIFSHQLIDHTPLQGIRAMGGNGVDHYAAIPEITLAGDFEIEFDWVRRDVTGSSFVAILGSDGDNEDGIFLFDSAGPVPNGVQFRATGSGANLEGVFSGVAQGEHVKVRVERVSDVLTFYVNGIDKGFVVVPGAFNIERFGSYSLGSGWLNSECAFVTIRDVDQDISYVFSNKDDAGADFAESNLPPRQPEFDDLWATGVENGNLIQSAASYSVGFTFNSGSPTLSGTQYGADYSGFSYLGGNEVGPYDTWAPASNYYTSLNSTYESGARDSSGGAIEFYTDSPIFEISWLTRSAGDFAISVDGELVGSYDQVSQTNEQGYLKVDISGHPQPTAQKHIRLEFSQKSPFGGIVVGTGHSVGSVAPTAGLSLCFLGDSFTSGTGTDSTEPYNVWASICARKLGVNNYARSGFGGTGYGTSLEIAPGFIRPELPGRVSVDAVGYSAYVIAMGRNDAGDISRNAREVFTAIKELNPSKPVVVLGPWGDGLGNSVRADQEGMIEVAAATLNIPFVSVYDIQFTKSDSVHPDKAGHEALGLEVAARVQKVLGYSGLWKQGGTTMTDAEADAARTYLPLISRHYLFDTPGRIREVLGGDGPELVVNGSFADGAAGWSAGASWSFSNGTAINSGGSTVLSQAILEAGKRYRVRFSRLDMGGTINLVVGSQYISQSFRSDNDVVVEADGSTFGFQGGNEYILDGVSVRETNDAQLINLDQADWQTG